MSANTANEGIVGPDSFSRGNNERFTFLASEKEGFGIRAKHNKSCQARCGKILEVLFLRLEVDGASRGVEKCYCGAPDASFWDFHSLVAILCFRWNTKMGVDKA